MQIMIKVSDVSNEARPMEVAEPWLDCLLQEFFIQVGIHHFNKYTLFDGLTDNTRGHFTSCAVFFRPPKGREKNASNE